MEKKSRLDELQSLLSELYKYNHIIIRVIEDDARKEERIRGVELRDTLSMKLGYLEDLIDELSAPFAVNMTELWFKALNIPVNVKTRSLLSACIQATTKAIGRLADDIDKGKRDKNTGERIEVIPKKLDTSTRLKAFIAHEGETRALTMLKEFLEALGVQYFIAESKASDGRSIEKQVDWTQSKADFAICLATKGKAINKKTGKHYMAPNIIDELGRARQVFGNRIILLVQKGVEVHTNIKEIVYETFTTTNMERAFIKIAKELRNWDFIRTGKIEE